MQDAILTICWSLPDNYYLRTYIDSAVQAILIKNRLQNQASMQQILSTLCLAVSLGFSLVLLEYCAKKYGTIVSSILLLN